MMTITAIDDMKMRRFSSAMIAKILALWAFSRSWQELLQFRPVIKKIVGMDVTFGSIWSNYHPPPSLRVFQELTYFLYFFALSWVLPVLVMTFCYSSIIITIARSANVFIWPLYIRADKKAIWCNIWQTQFQNTNLEAVLWLQQQHNNRCDISFWVT